MTNQDQDVEDDITISVQNKSYTYLDMLTAYRKGREHEQDYGNAVGCNCDQPDFAGFMYQTFGDR